MADLIDAADFYGAPLCAGEACGDFVGFVLVFGFDKEVAADGFFGFCEGSGGDDRFGVSHADGFCGCCGLQGVDCEESSCAREPVEEGFAFGQAFFDEVLRNVGARSLVEAHKAEEFHVYNRCVRSRRIVNERNVCRRTMFWKKRAEPWASLTEAFRGLWLEYEAETKIRFVGRGFVRFFVIGARRDMERSLFARYAFGRLDGDARGFSDCK